MNDCIAEPAGNEAPSKRSSENNILNNILAAMAPAHWLIIYGNDDLYGNLFASANAMLTEGLK